MEVLCCGHTFLRQDQVSWSEFSVRLMELFLRENLPAGHKRRVGTKVKLELFFFAKTYEEKL